MRGLLLLLVATTPVPTPTVLDHGEPPSLRSELPSEERIVEAVFENLSVRFAPEQRCEASECTVGTFLRKTLAYLAESERVTPKGAWETALCESATLDDGFLESLEPPRYSPKLAPRLRKTKARFVWDCRLAFGYHDGGEVKWNRELKFLLADDPKHPVIADSFQFHYTP